MPSTPPLLTDSDLEASSDELRSFTDAVRARRGGRLLNLDRMLLHSLPFARGWSALLGTVRNELDLSPRLRELVICRVARLTGADYEYRLHSPLLLEMGVSEAQLAALDDPHPNEAYFEESEHLALSLATEMTCHISVDPALRSRLLDHFSESGLVEMTGLIATYNLVARFLIALDIQPEA